MGVEKPLAGARNQQFSFSEELCGKAVIACMHGAVLGAGLELVSACDIRFCTEDTTFQLAEVNLAIASDVGGLQRLPKIIGNQKLGEMVFVCLQSLTNLSGKTGNFEIGQASRGVHVCRSLVRELAFSGRKMGAKEAFQHGLVSRNFAKKEDMMPEALGLAKAIASKSPVATLGVKEFLNYTRDHSVSESLDYAITWNMGMLQGVDLPTATASMVQKSVPEFDNLPSVSEPKHSKL